MYVCHRGHYEGLSRCRLVGSCVLPGATLFRKPIQANNLGGTLSQLSFELFFYAVFKQAKKDASLLSLDQYHGAKKCQQSINRTNEFTLTFVSQSDLII